MTATLEVTDLRKQFAVGRIDLRGLLDFRLAYVADARRERNQDQYIQQNERGNRGGRQTHAAPRRVAQTLHHAHDERFGKGPGPDGYFPEKRQYRLSHASAPSAEKAASYQNSANFQAFCKNWGGKAAPRKRSAEPHRLRGQVRPKRTASA